VASRRCDPISSRSWSGSSIEGVGDLALTTNGILLPRLVVLSRAGLRRVNVHIDTLVPISRKIMRFGTLARSAGIEAGKPLA
jgi:molybdenum cofactor biosynthesis enzyme MoaA